jgi:hypothetical protein
MSAAQEIGELLTEQVDQFERHPVTEPGIWPRMPEAIYFADPVAAGSLSQSGAKKLLPPYCPAIYKHERDHGRPDTAAFDLGHAAHAEVLGTGSPIVEVESDDWRSKKAQQARDEARAAGGVPLLTADVQRVKAMAAKLREHPVASMLFAGNGVPEASAFWVDDETGVWRRARFDWLPEPVDGRLIIPDYKSAQTANPAAFAKSASDYGYHMQAPWYMDAARALLDVDDVSFLFVVQQKTPPYLVTVVELDRAALDIGHALNRRALNVYAQCVERGEWPDYSADDGVSLVALPYWYSRTVEELIS